MTDAYGDDLAFIHDAGFGGHVRSAVPVLLKALHAKKSGRVVDLGCGSGILAQEVIAAGYDLLGVDISPCMIARK